MDTYKEVAEVNLWGTIRTTKAFLPLIRRAKGKRGSVDAEPYRSQREVGLLPTARVMVTEEELVGASCFVPAGPHPLSQAGWLHPEAVRIPCGVAAPFMAPLPRQAAWSTSAA